MLSLETLEASPRYWPLGNPGSNHRPSSSITVPLTSRPSLADHRGKLLTTGNFQNCFFTAGGLCKEGWKCSSRNTHKVARLFEGNFPLPVTSALIGSRLHHLGLEKGCSSSLTGIIADTSPEPALRGCHQTLAAVFLAWKQQPRTIHSGQKYSLIKCTST